MNDLRRLVEHPDWMEDANCRGLDPEIFYPHPSESDARAKAICRACDVQSHCLAHAMNTGERHGIWGGLSERERRRLRRTHGAPTPRSPIDHGTHAGYVEHLRRGEEACFRCKRAHADYEHFTRPSRAYEDSA